MNRCCDRLHCEGRSGGFEGLQVIFGIWRRCRVEQEGDPGDARRNLFEQLQPLAGHRRLHIDETGDVAAWPRQARDEAAADRIGNDAKMMGMVRVCCSIAAVVGVLCERMRSGCSATSSFANRCINSASPVRPAIVDPDVAALRPSKLLESLPECGDEGLSFPVALGIPHQHTDPPHSVRLLRARRKRPRGRTAEKGDELASPHGLLHHAEGHTLAGCGSGTVLRIAAKLAAD